MNHPPETEIWSFVAGELPAGQEGVVAAHLAHCAECQRSLRIISGFRTHARESGRLPSEFESARMAKELREQIQRQTRVQRGAWLPSRVAAAVAFATLSGAAVAMTASGTWPLFSSSGQKSVSPAMHSANATQPTKAPETRMEIAEEAALASEPLSDSTMSVPGLAEQGETGATRDNVASEHKTGDRGTAHFQSRSISKSSPPGQKSKIASVPRRSRQKASPNPVRTKTEPAAKIAMLPIHARPSASIPVDQRQIDIAPGTPAPLIALRAEEERLSRTDAEAGWLPVGDAYIQMGDTGGAQRAYFQSLTGVEAVQAANRLQAMVSKGMATKEELIEELANHSPARSSAEGMRLLCEWRLKVRPDRQAVQACQVFGQAHPAHPAVHRLALAAGLVAENHLQDWDLAIEEYSRALVVSEFAELPSSDALFFRARARARLGQIQEARADLRLFLHVDSSSWNRKEVDDLMRTLNISPQ